MSQCDRFDDHTVAKLLNQEPLGEHFSVCPECAQKRLECKRLIAAIKVLLSPSQELANPEEVKRQMFVGDIIRGMIVNAVSMEALRLKYLPLVDLPGLRLVAYDALLLKSSFYWVINRDNGLDPDIAAKLIEIPGIVGGLKTLEVADGLPTIFGRGLMRHLDCALFPAHLVINTRESGVDRMNFAARVEAFFESYAIDPTKVVLRVTQDHLNQNPLWSRQMGAQLNAIGAKVLLSDVYDLTNLQSQATHLSLAQIRTSVNVLPRSLGPAADIAKEVVSFAHSIGASATMEDVQSQEQIELASRAGFDFARVSLPGGNLQREGVADSATDTAAFAMAGV